MRFSPRFLSLVLTPTLIFGPVSAQTSVVSPSASTAAIPGALQLKVEGDAADVPVGSRSAKGFVIEVNDANGSPAADAAITLRLPDSGPTGTFPDGSHAAVAYTDSIGHATVSGIQWGSNPGVVSIRVTANKGTAHAGTLIQQTLIAGNEAVLARPSVQPKAVLPEPFALPVPADLSVAPPVQAYPAFQQLPSPPPPPADALSRANVVAPRLADPGQPAQASASLTAPSRLASEPSVSVSNSPNAGKSHSSKTKWVILAAVIAAGAGAGVAMMGKKSSSGTNSSGGVSIGPPVISVGHP